MNLVKLIILSLCLCPVGIPTASFAGGGERGGGDIISTEFIEYGAAIQKDLKRFAVLPSVSVLKFEEAVKSFRVEPVKIRPKDSLGVERDAVTDLSLKKIQVYTPTWLSLVYSEMSKIKIVTHEYLRASGYGKFDETYALTNQYLKFVSKNPKNAASLGISDALVNELHFLRAIGKKGLSCKNKSTRDTKRSSFTITPAIHESGHIDVRIRYSDGTEYSEGGGSTTFQISSGPEFITLSYGDDGRAVFLIPNVNPNEGACVYGTVTYYETNFSSDLPSVDVLQCCLL